MPGNCRTETVPSRASNVSLFAGCTHYSQVCISLVRTWSVHTSWLFVLSLTATVRALSTRRVRVAARERSVLCRNFPLGTLRKERKKDLTGGSEREEGTEIGSEKEEAKLRVAGNRGPPDFCEIRATRKARPTAEPDEEPASRVPAPGSGTVRRKSRNAKAEPEAAWRQQRRACTGRVACNGGARSSSVSGWALTHARVHDRKREGRNKTAKT